MRKQIEVLEHHSDFPSHFIDPFDVVGQLDSIDHDRSTLMFLEPIDAPDQRRFAGARRTAHNNALSALNREVDVPQYVKAPVPFVDAGESDCGVVASIGVGQRARHYLRPLARTRSI
jgi:hypothetical protein